MRMRLFTALLLTISASAFTVDANVSEQAKKAASYAVDNYRKDQIRTLRSLVSFPTVADSKVAITEQPAMNDLKAYLKRKSEELGLDYQVSDYMVVIGYGQQNSRIGIVTHGDVQPADLKQWSQSPFSLDEKSEPGVLIGRGTEDDKGPIATALYAMKTIKDLNIELNRRIELYIYLAEESDWEPFKAYIKNHEMPDLNLTIDSSYPVVVAEKGWSQIKVTVPVTVTGQTTDAFLSQFSGGSFASQIPEQARVTISNADKELIEKIKQRAALQTGVEYTFDKSGNDVKLTVKGKSAHSSEPKNGINAVAFLADALDVHEWPANTAGLVVRYLNELVGTEHEGKQFGEIAYKDDFMGPMTVAPTLIKRQPKGIDITLNLRRPIGKSAATLTTQAETALASWQKQNDVTLLDASIYWGEPMVVKDAPHVQPLLDIFSEFTGVENPQPLSSGGSTNAKLLPQALSFGPSMPGVPYSGHSEHEYISVKQFTLNLKMYTAMMIELGNLPTQP